LRPGSNDDKNLIAWQTLNEGVDLVIDCDGVLGRQRSDFVPPRTPQR